jgi:hypothetical protein
MIFSTIVIFFFLLVSFGPLGFVFTAMETCSLGVSVTVEGQCYTNIHGSMFPVCSLSGTVPLPTAENARLKCALCINYKLPTIFI